MNKDREVIDEQLTSRGANFKLPGSSPERGGGNVWDRLSRRQRVTMRSMSTDAFDDLSFRPAFFHTHSAEYSRAAYEASHIGSVPPIPREATELLSYADPGGAATETELERLTLTMINNHDADGKAFSSMSRDQTNRSMHETARQQM